MSDSQIKALDTSQATTTTQVKRDWAAQEVFGANQQADSRQIRTQWSGPVLDGLDLKLARLEQAAASFAWPQGQPPWQNARLVTGQAEAAGRVSATTLSDQQAAPALKMLSAGFESAAPTGLAAGSYAFNLTLGGQTEAVGVAVEAADTWGAVLSKVKNAVNAAALPVRADVVYNNAAFQQDPDMAQTGSVLTFTVNPRRQGQSLQAADTAGGLLRSLGMAATKNAIGPAQTVPYEVTGLAQAMPTAFSSTPTDPRAASPLELGRHDLAVSNGLGANPQSYISKVFAPGEATTLAAGTYAFTATYDGETRDHTVNIGSSWTWGDVLRAVGAEILGQYAQVNTASPTSYAPSTTYSQPGLDASVDYWPIPSSTQQNVYTDGQSLTVSGQAGKELALTDGGQGLLDALGLSAKLTGTPVSFTGEHGDTVNDAYVSMAIAIGGSPAGYLAASRLNTAVPSTVTPGKDLQHQGLLLSLVQQGRRIGQNISLSDGRTGALARMGLDVQSPGQDARMVVNGKTLVSENNTFSLDKGRVLLDLNEPADETIPLSVTTGMDAVQKGLATVAEAYNDLMKYVKNNADVLRPGLSQALEAPFAARLSGLKDIGIARTGRQGLLWANLDAFWSATYPDPQRSEALLADPATGLMPELARTAADIRAAGLESWLKPTTAFDARRPSLTSEFELEQKHRLLHLLG